MEQKGIFDDLQKKLSESIKSFPHVYMFKFIIKADSKTMALVEGIFDEDADINHKESSGGKYLSITVKQVVMSVDEVIDFYQRAAKIEGVMSL